MGLFGLGEVLFNIESATDRVILTSSLSRLLPTKKDSSMRAGRWREVYHRLLAGHPARRGAIMASFVSYAFEKKLSKYPEKFGTGVMEE